MKICRNLFHLITARDLISKPRVSCLAPWDMIVALGFYLLPHAKWAALDAKGAAHIFGLLDVTDFLHGPRSALVANARAVGADPCSPNWLLVGLRWRL
jgi:hypothetical protein